MLPRNGFALIVLLFSTLALAVEPKPASVKTLFDFEDAAELKAWSNLELPDAKQKEPPAKFELSTEHATSGKHSLKITFAGGRWPTLTTTQVPADWLLYQTFKADVTVTRPCLVGFTVLQEKSRRGGGWENGVSRWCKTEFLRPGTNEVTGILHTSNEYSVSAKLGKVVRFEMFLYAPHKDEVIWVDNIRLSTKKEVSPPVKTSFHVLGTDLKVSGVQELGKKLQDRWTKTESRTIEQVESAIRGKYERVKKEHPHALLAILRDGEKGGDPAHPNAVYTGWKDAYWSSHGPDGLTVERTANGGRHASQEVFMRHRSPLMRVELSSIPKGSKILAAQLAIVRANDISKDRNPETQPTMWVAEACNRPWEEYEVNTYEYAKDKFWKAIGGQYYGDDADFLPIYLAYGPGSGRQANVWDFTEAVRFWTNGEHANHGFMLHGDSRDYLIAFTREAKEIKNRPVLFVIYEPN